MDPKVSKKFKLTRDELLTLNKCKSLFRNIKKLADNGATAETMVELVSDKDTIYYLLNIIKGILKPFEESRKD